MSATSRLLQRHSIKQTLKSASGMKDAQDDGTSQGSCAVGSQCAMGNNFSTLLEVDGKPKGHVERLLQVPGVCMFPIWLLAYYFVSVLTHMVSAKLCKRLGKAFEPQGTEKDISRVHSIYWLAVTVFSVVIMMQLAFMVFQISAKKRILGSLVMFIQLVAGFTYLSHIYGWIGPISDPSGKEIQITRWIEWMSTTPMMLLVISAVGNSMRTSLVESWPETVKMLLWDELMLVFGLLHSISNNAPWGMACLILAMGFFVLVYQCIHAIVAKSIASAATTYEIFSMRGLEWFTYVLWGFFPAVHALYYTGVIDWLEYEIASTFIDVLTKAVYSVSLLTGNFCILDVMSTLRVAQMQAQRDSKANAVIKAEAINEALQTTALEAEAQARLTRRFLANISHELR